MENKKAKILLVEDDTSLAFVTRDNLESKGYKIVHCTDGASGFEAFQKESFAVCLLDVMLPKMDGLTLAEKIRMRNKQVPVIFITAKSMLEDKLAGFRIGADDYITKPFSIDELIFKIEVFLKRSKVYAEQKIEKKNILLGKYQFDFSNLILSNGEEKHELTLREAEVLNLLCNHINEVVARENILVHIWGENDYFLGRSLDVFISRLRKYLKEDSNVSIDNIHSVGFKLVVKQ